MSELPSAGVDRRTTAREATTRRIERNAVELSAEHGFDAVTVDMICAASGISQRTFFNHFATKDAAVLGRDLPIIDGERARLFPESTGPLLGDTVRLVSLLPTIEGDPSLAAARLRVVASTPSLFVRQMQRFEPVRAEIAGLIEVRLRRSAPAGESAAETGDRAELIAQLVAGALLFAAGRVMAGERRIDLPELLDDVLGRIADGA